MKRREFLKRIGLGAGMSALSPLIMNKLLFSQTAKKPNIIFIITDDQQKNMFNFTPEGKGQNLSPNIDKLWKEGVLFKNQHCTSPICTPSRFACLTGKYPSRAKNTWFQQTTKKEGQSVVQFNTKITPDIPTIASYLKKAGYTTGFVGKNHVINVPGLKVLPLKTDPTNPDAAKQLKANSELFRQEFKKCGFDYAESIYHNNPQWIGPRALAVHNMDWIAKAGLDFIEKNKDKPFFLYFATTIPHGPSDAKHSWNADRRYTAEGVLPKPLDILPPASTYKERLKKANISGWGKENILWLDDAVGSLLKKLEEHRIEDNTIIIYFNDHGMPAKGTIYQGGVETQCFIWKKGGFLNRHEINAFVSNIDFAPTILDIAGIQYDLDDFDGKSMLPLLNGEANKIHDSLFFELGYTRGVRKGKWKYLALRYPEYANKLTLKQRERILAKHNNMMRKRGKEIHNTDPTKPFSHLNIIPGGGGPEYHSMKKYPAYNDKDQLYNLQTDPDEQKNLAKDTAYADILKEMKQELSGYLQNLPGGFGEFK